MDYIDLARKVIPKSFRSWIQRYVSFTGVKLRYAKKNNPYADILESDADKDDINVRIGIIRNAAQYHQHYVAACLEMGIPFRVLDISGPDWVAVLRRAECNALLVWPDAHLSTWNRMIKDRITLIERELELKAFPSPDEIWMYEDKVRTACWLMAHDVPHPKTWIYYDKHSAMEFADGCKLPVVFKAPFGASAAGVEIIRSRSRLRRIVKKVFRSGYVPAGYDHRDRQWGILFLQEYIPNAKEWRLVRIGNSFFGHVKGLMGDFHSGSGEVVWDVPSERHLDFLKKVTDEGGFRSMDLDAFETSDGKLLVNELQAVFGASHSVDQLKIDGKTGRFIKVDGTWTFEAGDFARNACANFRIEYCLDNMKG